MAKDKITRDKAMEKAVKIRLGKTHLKSVKILGSEVIDGVSTVYVLRIAGVDNYLFKVKKTVDSEGKEIMSGLIPVVDPEDAGQYRIYNPKAASADVLRPIGKEKNFKGYSK